LPKQHVYLVPGFFGFTTLGSLNYFQGVREVLEARLADHGTRAVIHETQTMPTGSIRHRAVRLLHTVDETGGLEADGVHFVGHSTGGLDARLLVTPGVELVPTDDEERVGKLTRSVQTLSTPHFGTPLANFFTTLQGRNLLYLLTLFATTGPGRLGLTATAQYLALVARVDDFIGQTDTMLDLMAERLLKSVSAERGNELWDFMHEISQDQGAVIQLTPEAVDLFNAAVTNRESTRYVSHVSASPPPLSRLSLSDFDSLYAPVAMALYGTVYRITAKEHRSYPYPSPSAEAQDVLEARLTFKVDSTTNDGIVPALSQVWGEIGQVIEGDHLDVVGQYQREWQGQRLPGWLESGAGFEDADMEALWDGIARVIAETAS
jgi:triacylglycerol esterase/lipase EstA (alpha/beta hydrolase family)